MWHELTWFLNRIGTRIYRYTDNECCEHCQNVFKNGLIIENKTHAHYLFDCQNDMNLTYDDIPYCVRYSSPIGESWWQNDLRYMFNLLIQQYSKIKEVKKI